MPLRRIFPVGKTAVNSSASVNTVSVSIMAANANRQSAIIQNVSAESVFLGFGATAKNNNGLKLYTKEKFVIDQTNMYLGAINCISTGAAGVVTTVEFSK